MTRRTYPPDHTPALLQPQKPVEPPRRLRSRWRRFPTISRLCPTDSRLFPDCFPGASQLDMLQLLACPGKGVRIHPVIWASVPVVAAQRPGRFHHRKECLTWFEAV